MQIIDNNICWPNQWGQKTSIMGIMNLTPDSFSDGGELSDVNLVLKRVQYLIDSGVDVIDLGGQSTRPGAVEVGTKIEILRLIPSLKEIRSKYPELLISVDTFNSEVAYEALLNGANWINDVTGGRRDERILEIVSEFKCPFVITHSKGNSQTMNQLTKYDNLIEDILSDLTKLTEKALSKNIRKDKIIWDPGIGFAKNSYQNILILKNLSKFKCYGYPILIGASRKRFIGEILGIDNPQDRDIGTLAISSICSKFKVDLVRVHNVSLNYQVLKLSDAVYRF